MSVNNLDFKEKKRKLSDVEESSRNNSKKKNVDIKPNIDMICKNIKKEPDFLVKEIKKEPNFVVREIKKEPDFVVKEIKREPRQSDIKLEPQHLAPKSKIKKQKNKTNKKKRKATAKAKKHKKSTVANKTKSCERNFNSKKSKRHTAKSKKKSKSARKNIKKEANTLLDQQGNGDLRLFGFKDELEYFSSESDHKEFEDTISEDNVTAKRTRLSSLSARDKVIHALKSAPKHPSSNPRPLIQQVKNENFDLLGSILKNQTLWHSKTSHMKVNEDGSVEVIDKKNKKLAEIESTNDKEMNLVRSKTNSTVSTQARNVHLESVNLSENIGTDSKKINVKTEPYDATETWDTENVTHGNNEQIWEEKIKAEVKKEKNSSSSVSEMTFANLPKTEKSEDEEDDCLIISVHSKASKMFSLQRDEEKQMRFLSDEPEIKVIEIKEIEKTEGNKPSKRCKNYQEEINEKLDTAERPSVKRKKEENKQRKNVTCIIVE